MSITLLIASCARATASLFNPKLWWLVWLPFIVSLLLCGAAAYYLFDPLSAVLRDAVSGFEFPQLIKALIPTGLFEGLRTVWVPLLILLLALPLVVITGLLLMGLLAMPFISRHAHQARYPALERRGRAVFFRSVLNATWTSVVFLALWLLALITWLIPFLGFLVHVLLWAWLVARVFRFDALCEYASAEELAELTSKHRAAWLFLGFLGSSLSSIATGLWFSGVIMMPFIVFTTLLSLWCSLLVFLWTGLAFSYYGLGALQQLRERTEALSAAANGTTPAATASEVSAVGFAYAKDITHEVSVDDTPPALMPPDAANTAHKQ